jgi:hypothetical protein
MASSGKSLGLNEARDVWKAEQVERFEQAERFGKFRRRHSETVPEHRPGVVVIRADPF